MPTLPNRQNPIAAPGSAWWPGGRTAQKLRRFAPASARSTASSTQPAPAVAASHDPSLATVSASNRPPPEADIACTSSMYARSCASAISSSVACRPSRCSSAWNSTTSSFSARGIARSRPTCSGWFHPLSWRPQSECEMRATLDVIARLEWVRPARGRPRRSANGTATAVRDEIRGAVERAAGGQRAVLVGHLEAAQLEHQLLGRHPRQPELHQRLALQFARGEGGGDVEGDRLPQFRQLHTHGEP